MGDIYLEFTEMFDVMEIVNVSFDNKIGGA